VWAAVGIIVGRRLGSILLYNPGYYAAHPLKMLAFSEGGMSFQRGLLGVAAASLAFGWSTGAPVLRLGDLLACVAPIGLFLGRLANFINGELWGRPTDLPWGVIFPRSSHWQRAAPSQSTL